MTFSLEPVETTTRCIWRPFYYYAWACAAINFNYHFLNAVVLLLLQFSHQTSVFWFCSSWSRRLLSTKLSQLIFQTRARNALLVQNFLKNKGSLSYDKKCAGRFRTTRFQFATNQVLGGAIKLILCVFISCGKWCCCWEKSIAFSYFIQKHFCCRFWNL